jgi:hypothetical protein
MGESTRDPTSPCTHTHPPTHNNTYHPRATLLTCCSSRVAVSPLPTLAYDCMAATAPPCGTSMPLSAMSSNSRMVAPWCPEEHAKASARSQAARSGTRPTARSASATATVALASRHTTAVFRHMDATSWSMFNRDAWAAMRCTRGMGDTPASMAACRPSTRSRGSGLGTPGAPEAKSRTRCTVSLATAARAKDPDAGLMTGMPPGAWPSAPPLPPPGAAVDSQAPVGGPSRRGTAAQGLNSTRRGCPVSPLAPHTGHWSHWFAGTRQATGCGPTHCPQVLPRRPHTALRSICGEPESAAEAGYQYPPASFNSSNLLRLGFCSDLEGGPPVLGDRPKNSTHRTLGQGCKDEAVELVPARTHRDKGQGATDVGPWGDGG